MILVMRDTNDLYRLTKRKLDFFVIKAGYELELIKRLLQFEGIKGQTFHHYDMESLRLEPLMQGFVELLICDKINYPIRRLNL